MCGRGGTGPGGMPASRRRARPHAARGPPIRTDARTYVSYRRNRGVARGHRTSLSHRSIDGRRARKPGETELHARTLVVPSQRASYVYAPLTPTPRRGGVGAGAIQTTCSLTWRAFDLRLFCNRWGGLCMRFHFHASSRLVSSPFPRALHAMRCAHHRPKNGQLYIWWNGNRRNLSQHSPVTFINGTKSSFFKSRFF